MPDRTARLTAAARHAQAFLDTLDERPVAARVDAAEVREVLGGPVPEQGEDPRAVVDALVARGPAASPPPGDSRRTEGSPGRAMLAL